MTRISAGLMWAALALVYCGTSLPVAKAATSTTPQGTPAFAMARPGASKRFVTDGSSGYIIDGAGHLWAWGDNKVGELGDGTTVDHATPVRVQFPADLGDASIITVAVNGHHSAYALDSAGHLWAWGDNAHAQLGLGHGDLANRSKPTQVRFPAALGAASIVSVATVHNDFGPVYAVDSVGHLWAWGSNWHTQLTDGPSKDLSTPARVLFPLPLGNASIVRVEVDDDDNGFLSIYALDSAGHLWAWGDNEAGQLGNGSKSGSLTPAQVQFPGSLGSSSIVSMATGSAGNGYVYALDSTGHLWAWGSNGYGLGLGSTTGQSTPARIRFPSPWWRRSPSIVRVMATHNSEGTAYAIDSTGHLWAWGGNKYGQLGNGTLKDHAIPVRVQFPSALGGASIIRVEADRYAAYAIDNAGHLWAWGNNRYGQLGNGLLANRFNPPALVQIPVAQGPASIVSMAAMSTDARSASAYAIDNDGHLWAWGYNRNGQLGNGSSEIVASPMLVPFQQDLPDQAQAPARDKWRATPGASLPKPQFLYVANSRSISAYRINASTGTLTDVPGSPFADQGGPKFLAVNPSATLAYVANVTGGTVSVYGVNTTTGALTEIAGSPFAAGSQPYVVKVSADGAMVYVGNRMSQAFTPYRIAPTTGAITPATGDNGNSIRHLAEYLPAPDVTVSPAGPFAYWLVNDGIEAFRIDAADGSNQEIPGTKIANPDAKSITINPEGTLAYVTEQHLNNTGDVLAYRLNATTGELTPVPRNPVATGLQNPVAVAVNPTGTFAYVANKGYGFAEGTISAYRINATTGALTEVPGSPFATGTRPAFITAVQP
ncbi:beta-propeller fold lactonase family protein [Rhodanobacter sp. C05]|uniref:RCC1 domain-containing protein n=1 Tax=Rhodanobacter sp. C05 TaxID=1945855 RepID=UPI00098732CE|nr:beta-propeller fold lactonase family protein [Rhodanobacter sp. C05]